MIFALPPADLGCHPIAEGDEIRHELSFYCDDIRQTIAELQGRGIRFTSEVVDEGWGLSTSFAMTGGGEIQLYQPRYAKPVWKEQGARRKTVGKKAAGKKVAAKKVAVKKRTAAKPAKKAAKRRGR